MKVIRDTPDQLILENNPIFLAIAISLFGLLVVGIGLFTIAENFLSGVALLFLGLGLGIGFNILFVRRTQLILHAPDDLVTLRRRGWMGDTEQTWALKHLEKAIVETAPGSDTTRPLIVFAGGMDAGTHPVTKVSSSGSGALITSETINRWLDRHRSTS